MYPSGYNTQYSSRSGTSSPGISSLEIHAKINASIQEIMNEYQTMLTARNETQRQQNLASDLSFEEHNSNSSGLEDHSRSNIADVESNPHMRRRAQNRASQRAFRERKEKHLRALEQQLEDLYEKHQDLAQSYAKQSDEVTRLTTRISELTSKLRALQSTQELYSQQKPSSSTDFESFDAFLPSVLTEATFSDNSSSSALNQQLDFEINRFEDSL